MLSAENDRACNDLELLAGAWAGQKERRSDRTIELRPTSEHIAETAKPLSPVAVVWVDIEPRYVPPSARDLRECTEEEKEILFARVRLGDRRAAEALIRLSTGLLRLMARKMRRRANFADVPEADLIQEGTIALLRAAATYDKTKGAWSTYACRGIYMRLVLETCRQGVPVSVPDHDVRNFLFGNKDDGAVRHAIRSKCWDEPTGDSSRSMAETFADRNAEGADELLDRLTMCETVRVAAEQAIADMPARTADLIRRRFFLDEPHSLAEIAAEYNISKERVRQIEEQGKHVLFERIRTAFGMEQA